MFVFALVLTSCSKLVLSAVIPGCGLLDRTFFIMVVQVCWSVLTSWSVCPFMVMCFGGFGGPLRMAWKTVSFLMAWLRKRAACVHSWIMSRRPAS